ncbi:MAG: sel1 repeat family protein, partial [Neisseriaceae bacterium]|nr:sel1 repeat family protein [Neisseriaceae bacterium]
MNISLIKKISTALLLATILTACGQMDKQDNPTSVGSQNNPTYGNFTAEQKKQYNQANKYIDNQEIDSAIKILIPLAEQGQADAQNSLAFIYIKQNKVLDAKQWFEKAAEQNHPE